MIRKKSSISSDLPLQRSEEILQSQEESSDHAESRVNIEFSESTAGKNFRPATCHGSEVSTEFVTVIKAAELEQVSTRVITNRCSNRIHKLHYHGAEKEIINGVAVWRIPVNSLSNPACAKYRIEKKAARIEAARRESQLPAVVAPPADRHAEYQQMWDSYDRKTDNFKNMAESALKILQAYHQYRRDGKNIGDAELVIEASHGVSRSTIRRYLDRTKNYPEYHWLPLLCPLHHGGRDRAEFTPKAYSYILGKRLEAPQCRLRVLIREAKRESARLRANWVFPSEDTIARRLAEEPAHLFLSPKELERSFPVIERNFNMEVHDMWETDGRRADVWCIWPDGTVQRPYVITYRDVRSRYVLSMRICHAPDTESAAGAFGAACRNAQAVPKYMKVDNGREYDNHTVTAGQSNRYRRNFKVDVADGLWKSMGIDAKFSKPANGRDKPIESFHDFISDHVDRLPDFAGAYCGKDTVSKPEDFDPKNAVPIDLYAAIAYSTETGHPFQCNLGQHSKSNWATSPRQSGPRFHANLDSRSVATRG